MRPTLPGPVLVVDDTASFALGVTLTLEELGLEPIVADSAAAALAVLRTRRVALVLSDFDMPGGNGLELLRELRLDAPELPFVLWSSAPIASAVADAARTLRATVVEKAVGDDLRNLLTLVASDTWSRDGASASVSRVA